MCGEGFSFSYCADRKIVDELRKEIETDISHSLLNENRKKLSSRYEYLDYKEDKKLTIIYQRVLKNMAALQKEYESEYPVSKYIPPLMNVSLKENKKDVTLTEYGSDVFPNKSHSIVEEALSKALISASISGIKLHLYWDVLLSSREIEHKKVFISSKIRSARSNHIGNVYLPEKNSEKDVKIILIHEAAHYLYTNNILRMALEPNLMNSLMSELESLYGKTTEFGGEKTYSIQEEIDADFYSLLFMANEGISTKLYLDVLGDRIGNIKRKNFVYSVKEYLEYKKSQKALLEIWSYLKHLQGYWVFNRSSKNGFSYASIVPLEKIINKYYNISGFQELILSVIESYNLAVMEEKNNEKKIQELFN